MDKWSYILQTPGLTLGRCCREMSEEEGDHLALIDPAANKRLSFSQIQILSNALAKELIHLGILPGDRIAIIVNNSWESIISKIAVSKTGAIQVNLNIHEKEAMLEKLLADSGCSFLIIKQGIKNRSHLEMLFNICPEFKNQKPGELHSERLPNLKHLILTDASRPQSCAWHFEELIEAGKNLPDSILTERDKLISSKDTATIIYTSGTTGTPKGVMLTHEKLLLNAAAHIHFMELTRDDVYCITAPLFHTLGSVGSFLSIFLSGGTAVLADISSIDRVLEVLIHEKCTVISSVPTILTRVLASAEQSSESCCTHLRLWALAGAACPEGLILQASEKLHVDHFMMMYGMTEAGPGISSTCLSDPICAVSHTVGRFWPFVEWEIHDLKTGNPLNQGEAGEIVIKSPCMMNGYFGNNESTEHAFTADGWLRTGDIGKVSPEGYLTLCGRCKNIIIRGGENISPLEIEQFLNQLPGICASAVVGVKDQEFGEAVYAFLITEGNISITAEDLMKMCRGRIATIKIPTEVANVKSFPLTASGKIAREELKQMAEANRKRG